MENDLFTEKGINIEDFNSIGEEHNKGLDFAYSKLEEYLGNLSDEFSVGEVINDDIKGGLSAAVGVWIVNVFPGGGQVAYGAITIGGAVTGSLISAINQII